MSVELVKIFSTSPKKFGLPTGLEHIPTVFFHRARTLDPSKRVRDCHHLQVRDPTQPTQTASMNNQRLSTTTTPTTPPTLRDARNAGLSVLPPPLCHLILPPLSHLAALSPRMDQISKSFTAMPNPRLSLSSYPSCFQKPSGYLYRHDIQQDTKIEETPVVIMCVPIICKS